jgi:hypothetical protein
MGEVYRPTLEVQQKRVAKDPAYARKDEGFLSELEKHLGPLMREGIIEVWSAHEIDPGADREQEIKKHLAKHGTPGTLTPRKSLAQLPWYSHP